MIYPNLKKTVPLLQLAERHIGNCLCTVLLREISVSIGTGRVQRRLPREPTLERGTVGGQHARETVRFAPPVATQTIGHGIGEQPRDMIQVHEETRHEGSFRAELP